jgi:hypothetical protein
MADFCKQCSIENFGEDFADFAFITNEADTQAGRYLRVLCEGCIPPLILVNHLGERVAYVESPDWSRNNANSH